jgi:hypothetical protein
VRPYQEAAQKRRNARRKRRFESALPAGLSKEQVALPGMERPGQAIREAGRGVRRRIGQVTGSGWHWSKLASGLLLAVALAGIYWVFTDPGYYVSTDTVSFKNLGYLDKEELAPLADLEGWSVFWLKPDEIRERVLAHPYVTDAQVSVGMPAQVTIAVEKAQPIALWLTKDATLWLLDDGSALTMRTEPGQPPEAAALDATGHPLPQIVDVNREAQIPGRSAMDPEVLHSALALLEQVPGLESVRYNEGFGLNFGLPSSEQWVYWGDGYDLSQKLKTLANCKQLIASGEASGQIIDVRYPNRPYIR